MRRREEKVKEMAIERERKQPEKKEEFQHVSNHRREEKAKIET